MNNKKDILFLCQFFYPENVSSATLPFDTAKYLAKQGFSVGALVGFPKEYAGTQNTSMTECIDDVNIKRIKYIQLSRNRKVGRLVNYFSFTAAMLMNLFYISKYKSIIVYSNPPILPLVAVIAKKLFGTKIVFVAYDIYPEMACATNSIKTNGIIHKVMNFINRVLYKNASIIVALTDEMKTFIINNRNGIKKEQIRVISNWAHEEKDQKPDKKTTDSEFVVSYIGNMGICQDMDTMLNAILELKNTPNIVFQIIGHGNKKDYIKNFLNKHNIKNVIMHDFLVGDELNLALNRSSCFIISLEKNLRGLCAPSKLYSYLLYGKPIISITEKESYLYKGVFERNIGIPIEIGDSKKLVNGIINLSNDLDKCVLMGNNARNLYFKKFTLVHAQTKYSKIFKWLLKR